MSFQPPYRARKPASLTFTDSKRPITADLLQRLNIHALAMDCGPAKQWYESRNLAKRCADQLLPAQAEFLMDGTPNRRE